MKSGVTNGFSPLIDAINRVGVQNFSLLSRLTNLPSETIRYKIKKQFPKTGLIVRLQVDYDRLGLQREFVILEFTQEGGQYADRILSKLPDTAYLTYHGHELFEQKYVTVFSIPTKLQREIHSFLQRLVSIGILRRFSIEPLQWTRHLSIRPEYCDFEKRKWMVNWGHAGVQFEAPPALPFTMQPSERPNIDRTDMLLIKELELEATRDISEIARKIRVNERTARWHYMKHVAPMINSYYVHWLGRFGDEALKKLIGVLFEFNGLSANTFPGVRRFFNNFPFTWNENGREDGYLLTLCLIPVDHLVEAMDFVRKNLPQDVSRWRSYTIDLNTSNWYTIPHALFNEKEGWFFNEEKAIKVVESLRAKEVKR